MRNIVVLISGGGTNMAAIVNFARRERWQERFKARVAVVISNNALADGLAFARDNGIATEVIEHGRYASRAQFDHDLRRLIDRYDDPADPALVLLAGFMRVLGADFAAHFAGRLVNIHPSLLPAFSGLHTHQRALDAGCRFAGATVHLVSAELDAGPILAQAVVPVLPGDSAKTLAARVLAQEHRMYPRAIAELLGAAQTNRHASQSPA
jgi:phosphoribosylglycinamide formyltransferase-1